MLEAYQCVSNADPGVIFSQLDTRHVIGVHDRQGNYGVLIPHMTDYVIYYPYSGHIPSNLCAGITVSFYC
jgi:hypothetical protein